MTKNILIISTFYPPTQHVATNRIYSFAKYLAMKGHRITVLTIDNGEDEGVVDANLPIEVYRIKDQSMFRPATFKKKTNRLVHYAKCLYNTLLYRVKPNEYSGWLKAGLPVARKIIEEKKIDCLISSFPPIAPHELAKVLKEENSELKWILDMRDAMSWCPRLNEKQKDALYKAEKKYLDLAEAVIAISKPQLDVFQNHCTKQILAAEVRNGYDFNFEFMKSNRSVFKIIYAGTFYGETNPDQFLKALLELDFLCSVKVEMIGPVKPINIPTNITDMVKVVPRKKYDQLIEYIKQEATILLLIKPKCLEKGVYSGKIFDYLGCGKPILGLVPKDDVAAALIREANAGYIAENEDVAEIKKAILSAYEDWQNHAVYSPNIKIIEQHHRSVQAEKLNEVIESLFISK